MENIVTLVRAYADVHGYVVRVHTVGAETYLYLTKNGATVVVSVRTMHNLLVV